MKLKESFIKFKKSAVDLSQYLAIVLFIGYKNTNKHLLVDWKDF